MKKQLTAVEWLQEQFKAGFNYNIEEGYEKRRDEIFAQAKEMEKEQKIEFACQVAESSAMKYIQGKTTRMIAEELLIFKSE
jgi:hypothetical protein